MSCSVKRSGVKRKPVFTPWTNTAVSNKNLHFKHDILEYRSTDVRRSAALLLTTGKHFTGLDERSCVNVWLNG